LSGVVFIAIPQMRAAAGCAASRRVLGAGPAVACGSAVNEGSGQRGRSWARSGAAAGCAASRWVLGAGPAVAYGSAVNEGGCFPASRYFA
jgi:hypothetical protein